MKTKKKIPGYNQQILKVEHGSFTPLVFSCFGRMSRECSCFFLHAAEHLANRRKEPKSKIITWIKARLNFALILNMLLCLHGASTPSNVDNISKIDLCAIVAESNIKWITYRSIPCYFMIINMYGYVFIQSLFRYFLCLYPVIRCHGTYFSFKINCMFYISNIYAGFILLKKCIQVLKIECAMECPPS